MLPEPSTERQGGASHLVKGCGKEFQGLGMASTKSRCNRVNCGKKELGYGERRSRQASRAETGQTCGPGSEAWFVF